MRLASPQTPEDAEALREHAAAFIAEQFPAPAGPDSASVAALAEYETERAGFDAALGPSVAKEHADWAGGVRDRAASAGAPDPAAASAGAEAGRGDVETELAARGAGRQTRAGAVRQEVGEGRDAIAAEHDRPFTEHAAEEMPLIGGWLAGKLYGTARNSAPDASGQPAPDGSGERRDGPKWGGP